MEELFEAVSSDVYRKWLNDGKKHRYLNEEIDDLFGFKRNIVINENCGIAFPISVSKKHGYALFDFYAIDHPDDGVDIFHHKYMLITKTTRKKPIVYYGPFYDDIFWCIRENNTNADIFGIYPHKNISLERKLLVAIKKKYNIEYNVAKRMARDFKFIEIDKKWFVNITRKYDSVDVIYVT